MGTIDRRSLIPAIGLTAILIALLECGNETPPPTIAAPTIPAPSLPPKRLNEPPSPQLIEGFDDGIDGWQGVSENESLSESTWHPDGFLQWHVEVSPEGIAGIYHNWPDLASAEGITIRLESTDRSTLLILGIHEADESAYGVVLPVDPDEVTEFTIGFDSFGLMTDSEDENVHLDYDQITSMSLVDFTGFISTPKPNTVLIDEIVLWHGVPETANVGCAAADTKSTNKPFNVGVDANFTPQGEDPYTGYRVGDKYVDPLELFAVNGANAFRLRLWVGERGESKLDYATELAKRAQDTGLRPYLVMFLSEDWADINKQPAPKKWSSLSIEDRADAIRDYAAETTQHFLDEGIDLEFYEIGNEIDYGIAGIFADTGHPRDPHSLRQRVWPEEARLIQAAIEGIHQVDPEAPTMLHIATGWSPSFALAFFSEMEALGVDYDYAGLSYYPASFGPPLVDQFCKTLERLSDEIGIPIVIAESAYPAEVPSGGMFGDWRRSLPGYPLTETGQAAWLNDLLTGMRSRGDILGVYVFSPEFWFSGELWSPFALFDGDGVARPAIASFDYLPPLQSPTPTSSATD